MRVTFSKHLNDPRIRWEQPRLGLSLLYPDILIFEAHSNPIQLYLYMIYVAIDLYTIDLQSAIFHNSIQVSFLEDTPIT